MMEQERDNEDLYDAFQGMLCDRKYSMPSQIAARRQPHSVEWRQAKKDSCLKFLDFVANNTKR